VTEEGQNVDVGMIPQDGFPEYPSQDPKWWWFHIILTAYGAWLYGDPRGFRTRHHREHVEGDYKHPPPPGMYADKEARSRALLKQEPVAWTPEWRTIVGGALVARLQSLGAFVLCTSVSRQHVHILAKLPRSQARAWSGLAKKHAWFIARNHGWACKMWGKRGKQDPVRDRRHHLNVYRYILNHVKEGAWVWCWKRKT
jgi:hypothetical protein